MALNFTCPSLGTMHDVIVTDITPDGKYRVQTRDGLYSMDVNDPGAVQLVDDDGNSIDPTTLSPPISETALLKAQVEALTARGEFLEDCLAELAMMVL